MASQMAFSSRDQPDGGKKTGTVLTAPENLPKEEENTERYRPMASPDYMQNQCQHHNQLKSMSCRTGWVSRLAVHAPTCAIAAGPCTNMMTHGSRCALRGHL